MHSARGVVMAKGDMARQVRGLRLCFFPPKIWGPAFIFSCSGSPCYLAGPPACRAGRERGTKTGSSLHARCRTVFRGNMPWAGWEDLVSRQLGWLRDHTEGPLRSWECSKGCCPCHVFRCTHRKVLCGAHAASRQTEVVLPALAAQASNKEREEYTTKKA